MRGKPPASDVDAYVAAAPPAVRAKLKQLRKLVMSVVPGAVEGISYGMPYYKWNGAFAGFAAFKAHIGFFPGAIVQQFAKDLAGYETAKGTVRFPLDEPLPESLIRKLLKAAVARNAAKASVKKSSPGRRRR